MQKLKAPTVRKADSQAPVTAWSTDGAAAAVCFVSPPWLIGPRSRALLEDRENATAGSPAAMPTGVTPSRGPRPDGLKYTFGCLFANTIFIHILPGIFISFI